MAVLLDDRLLGMVDLPIQKGLLHATVRAYLIAALIHLETEFPSPSPELLLEVLIGLDNAKISVLDRDDAGHKIEKALIALE